MGYEQSVAVQIPYCVQLIVDLMYRIMCLVGRVGSNKYGGVRVDVYTLLYYRVVNSYRATPVGWEPCCRVGVCPLSAVACVPAPRLPAPGSRPGVFYQQFARGV